MFNHDQQNSDNVAVSDRDIILTGDRPTGSLHLGHYVGSLQNRVTLQNICAHQFILIADLQALTDNQKDPNKVRNSVLEVGIDYLSVGIDPMKSTIMLQSSVPELSELTMLYLNLVTVARLERNPTIKSELLLREFQRDVPAGFLCYPVSQAADITAFQASVVPVGADQLPMIEQTNEIVDKINHLAGTQVLKNAKALIGRTGRLPGIDGKAKASKSLGNAIGLAAESDQLWSMVQAMYTDPNHLRVADPGNVEGNVVFAYLEAFDPDVLQVEQLKVQYSQGGLGDMALKRRLMDVLENVISPIRERRKTFASDPSQVLKIIEQGTEEGRATVKATLTSVRSVFGLNGFGC